MPTPRHPAPRQRRRAITARVASGLIVALALGGLAALGVPQQQADAAESTSSAVTVSWAGDATGQPARSTSSAHYKDFKNLKVTVAQTTNIIDQAIRVSVTGFAGTKSSREFGTNSQNYLQAMQCWGPDPLADDFMETCEWGGRNTSNNALGSSVFYDNVMRVAPSDAATDFDVPFRTVDGQKIPGKPVTVNGVTSNQLLNFFSPSTTNEVTSSRVGADGSGYFDFEAQTSIQAPQLGCGTTGHLRCWLVIVPRGTVFGGDGERCSSILDSSTYEYYQRGRPNSAQGGSPVNPHCDYWNNRINIPLDFTPTKSSCKVGGTEERVVGSQLMVGAMSSWQPSLCTTVGTTYSFSTNPDLLARQQVLRRNLNSPNIAYTGFPISSGELTTQDDRDLLASTDLSYAPVAISGVSVAFLAEFDAGRQEKLVVSPRLMAKFLTQSYTFTVPANSSDVSRNTAHLPEVNRRYTYLNQDPEFQKLNPDNYSRFTENPAIVLPGPAGADAIRQVWRWILADKAAVAFLNGDADVALDGGMTVNPYYLPVGNPKAVVPWWLDAQKVYQATPTQRPVGLANLDGSPQKLSETLLDTFPKDDESLVPLQLGVEKSRFDTIQFAPYSDNLLTAARQGFRADPNSKSVWDGAKVNAAGETGDWVSSGAQLPGSKFMIVVTDSVSAVRYALGSAALVVPNSTSAVQPTTAGMTAALSALRPTSLDTVTQVDPAQVPADGYPLTMVTYAGVNMSKSSQAARFNIAVLLSEVTTTGQVPGSAIGQLPAGYLPLNAALLKQSTAAAAAIKAYVPRTSTASSSSGSTAQDSYAAGGYSVDADSSSAAGGGTTTDPTETSIGESDTDDRTEGGGVESVARSGLAISLGVGVAGFLFSPLLFRRRLF